MNLLRFLSRAEGQKMFPFEIVFRRTGQPRQKSVQVVKSPCSAIRKTRVGFSHQHMYPVNTCKFILGVVTHTVAFICTSTHTDIYICSCISPPTRQMNTLFKKFSFKFSYPRNLDIQHRDTKLQGLRVVSINLETGKHTYIRYIFWAIKNIFTSYL